MTKQAAPFRSSIVPTIRYRDATRAVTWLCETFGFSEHAVYKSDDGKCVVHAELVLGGGMIMLGPVAPTEFGKHMIQPDEIGGFETQSCYLAVPDADAVYSKLKANGGSVVREIRDEEYGGRGFVCRDFEGRLWSVGTYDPWRGS